MRAAPDGRSSHGNPQVPSAEATSRFYGHPRIRELLCGCTASQRDARSASGRDNRRVGSIARRRLFGQTMNLLGKNELLGKAEGGYPHQYQLVHIVEFLTERARRCWGRGASG